MGADGQVTLEHTVLKHKARKVRRLYNEQVLAGFAGSTSDAFALFQRFEASWMNITATLPARPLSFPRSGGRTEFSGAWKRFSSSRTKSIFSFSPGPET